MNVVLSQVAVQQEKITFRKDSAKALARQDFSRDQRSWWSKDLKINFHDADLNMKHSITVSAYLEEYSKLTGSSRV